jgi:hypothetical protein
VTRAGHQSWPNLLQGEDGIDGTRCDRRAGHLKHLGAGFILCDHCPAPLFHDLDTVRAIATPTRQDDGNNARGEHRGDRGKEHIGRWAQ